MARGMGVHQYAFISLLAAAVAVGTSVRKLAGDAHTGGSPTVKVLLDIQSSLPKLVVLLNALIVAFYLLLNVVVFLFLDRLRQEESRALKEKTVNFLLFKAVFVGATLTGQAAPELAIWIMWFSLVGFIHLVVFLCRNRFEYYSWAPVAQSQHVRLLVLLVGLLALNGGVFFACVTLFHGLGLSTVLLLVVDCVTPALSACQTLVKYAIHYWDVRSRGTWEHRSSAVFYTEFAFDTAALVVTLAHYIHIWTINGLTFQIIDAVLFLNTRSVFMSLFEKIGTYKSFLRVSRDLNNRFPDVTPEELRAHDDSCAICQQDMLQAKRLPCGHMFHRMCLRQWLQRLESHGRCPICRQSVLSDPPDAGGSSSSSGTAAAPPGAPTAPTPAAQPTTTAATTTATAAAATATTTTTTTAAAADTTTAAAATPTDDGSGTTAAAGGLAPDGIRRRRGTSGDGRAAPSTASTTTAHSGTAAPTTPAATPATPTGGAAAGTAGPAPRVTPFGVGNDFATERPLFRWSSHGSGFGAWLPFSLEIAGSAQSFGMGMGMGMPEFGGAPAAATAAAANTPEIQGMARQVLTVLPHLSPAAVRRDLVSTRSVQVTLERALSGLIPSATPEELAAAATAAAATPAPMPTPTPTPAPAARQPSAAPVPPQVPAPAPASTSALPTASVAQPAVVPVVSAPAPAATSGSGSGSGMAGAGSGAGSGAGRSALHDVSDVTSAASTTASPPVVSPGDSTDSDTIEAEVRGMDQTDRYGLFQARKRALLRRARRDYRRRLRSGGPV